MTRFCDRSSNGDRLQGQLFDKIVTLFAKENDVPMMAAGGYAVLEEIELAVESFLLRESRPVMNLTPEISAMAEMWRHLEREATRARRMTIDWGALVAPLSAPMVV
jgi:hypothetical protein